MTTYDNYHFTIDRSGFNKASADGLYGSPKGCLSVAEISPTYQAFIPLLDKYGGAWGWNRRPKYLDQKFVEARLAETETRLFELCEAGKTIGYCMLGGVKQGLKDQFWESANGMRVAEIENIALDSEFTGNGRGRYFLEHIIRDLLVNYDAVYLSSRSTNHNGVPHFYSSMGMNLTHVEYGLPDDLVPVLPLRASTNQQHITTPDVSHGARTHVRYHA